MIKLFGESYILISDDKEQWSKSLFDYQKLYKVSKENTIIVDEPNIKIEHIRKIKNKLSLIPSDNQKILVGLFDAQNITREAQNAFLKILEEPPYYVVIILFVKNIYGLLPTIISRCKKIYLPRTIEKNIEEKNIEVFKLIDKADRIYEKQVIANIIAKNDKINIDNLLNDYIIYLKKEKSDYNKIKIINTYKTMYKNGINKKLFLENMLQEI